MTLGAPSASNPCLALDIGGTKIEAGLVTQDGRILRRRSIATHGSSSELFDRVTSLLRTVSEGFEPSIVGVGCGGPMRGGGASVSPLNIAAWREFPLRTCLEEVTRLPVYVDNDAKALALAEGRYGSARGVENYLSMVVSTGIGGGLVLDGRLLDGRDGNAGHIGHVTVEPEGRACECGARGCLEAEASGTAIAAITGRPAAEADDAMRRRSGKLVGRAVSSAAALLDFDRCFVAGSVALGFGETFFRAANDEVAERARIVHAQQLRIEPSGLGADGPLLGAAQVAWREVGG